MVEVLFYSLVGKFIKKIAKVCKWSGAFLEP